MNLYKIYLIDSGVYPREDFEVYVIAENKEAARVLAENKMIELDYIYTAGVRKVEIVAKEEESRHFDLLIVDLARKE